MKLLVTVVFSLRKDVSHLKGLERVQSFDIYFIVTAVNAAAI